MAHSIWIFGSAARGTADDLSDRDVLIVGDDDAERTAVDELWRGSGWSVTSFTLERFEKMSAYGSLFIEHLQKEGIRIRDDHGQVARVFSNYVRKDSYEEELLDALGPLAWISESPSQYWTAMCSADILYVAMRNVGVLASASTESVRFDYFELVNLLADRYFLTPEQEEALVRLRVLKIAYRNRSIGVDVFVQLEAALKAARKVGEQIRRGYSARNLGDYQPNGYHRLRRVELALVEKQDPRILDSLSKGAPGFELWQLICNPSDYPKLRQFTVGWSADRDFLALQVGAEIYETSPYLGSALPSIGSCGSP